jgi:AraC-like DNA-binding protein
MMDYFTFMPGPQPVLCLDRIIPAFYTYLEHNSRGRYNMIREHKTEGFKNEQFFVIPDPFLDDYRRAPYLSSLLITLMGYFPRALNHYIKRPEGCGTALMIYCSSGSGFYSINNGPIKNLSAGQILIIPPRTPHEYGASEDNPWSIYWVHFKGAFYQPFYEAVSPFLPISIGDVIGDRIKDIFNQCFCLLQLPYQKEEYAYLCQMTAAMLSLIPCTVKQSNIGLTFDGYEGIERAIIFMKNNLHKKITGAELADQARFSYSRLSYLFKHSTGYAPIEFFLRTKIQAAARDIYFSSLPIRDIALTYGIEDPYYFSRLFKKMMGISPQKFRNKTYEPKMRQRGITKANTPHEAE